MLVLPIFTSQGRDTALPAWSHPRLHLFTTSVLGSTGGSPSCMDWMGSGWDYGKAVTSTGCAVQAQAPPAALLCWVLGLDVGQQLGGHPHIGKSALDSWILQFDSLVWVSSSISWLLQKFYAVLSPLLTSAEVLKWRQNLTISRPTTLQHLQLPCVAVPALPLLLLTQ